MAALRIGRCLLSDLLNERRLSQVEFALSIGMSESTISHYVTKRRIMSLENAKIIADELKIPIDDLYEWQKVE
jgi:transcriptional regulator with XRE-family HTH domain